MLVKKQVGADGKGRTSPENCDNSDAPSLIVYACDQLQRSLPEDLRARVAERVLDGRAGFCSIVTRSTSKGVLCWLAPCWRCGLQCCRITHADLHEPLPLSLCPFSLSHSVSPAKLSRSASPPEGRPERPVFKESLRHPLVRELVFESRDSPPH